MTKSYDIIYTPMHTPLLCSACDARLSVIAPDLRHRHADRYINIKVPKSHLGMLSV